MSKTCKAALSLVPTGGSAASVASVAITVRIADTRAQLIPDLTLTLPLK